MRGSFLLASTTVGLTFPCEPRLTLSCRWPDVSFDRGRAYDQELYAMGSLGELHSRPERRLEEFRHVLNGCPTGDVYCLSLAIAFLTCVPRTGSSGPGKSVQALLTTAPAHLYGRISLGWTTAGSLKTHMMPMYVCSSRSAISLA